METAIVLPVYTLGTVQYSVWKMAGIRRCEAMRIVFERNTDKFRQELKIEINDLNSKLLSKRLISESVMEAKNIDVTLEAMRSTLTNKDNTERAFDGFREAVSEITSKSHLANDMSKALEEIISLPHPAVSAVSAPTCQEVGRLVVTGPSFSTRQVGENVHVVPPIATVVCGTYSQRILKGQKDSAISSTNEEETMDFAVPVQPSTDGNNLTYPLVSDAQGTISSRDSSKVAEFELAETKRKCIRIQLQKHESDKMLLAKISELTKKDKEIEQLACLHLQQETEYNQLHQEFISVKKQSLTQEDTIKEYQEKIRTAEERNRQAEEKVQKREDEAYLADERVRKAEEEAELAKQRVRKAEEEANLAVEKLKKAEVIAKLAEEKVRRAERKAELAKRKAEEKEENVEVLQQQIMKYKQEAAVYKERANKFLRQYNEMTDKYQRQYEQINKKAELAERKAEELERRLKEKEEESQLHKRSAFHTRRKQYSIQCHHKCSSLRHSSPVHEFSPPKRLEQEVENFGEGASSSCSLLEDRQLGIRVQLNNTTSSVNSLQQEHFKRKCIQSSWLDDLMNF